MSIVIPAWLLWGLGILAVIVILGLAALGVIFCVAAAGWGRR